MVDARTRTEKFVGLLSKNAAFEKFNRNMQARYSYRLISRRLGNDNVTFLNFGYEEDPPMGLPLVESDEPNRLPIQLYHTVAAQVDLTGKQVLEVSCGHGGGAAYIMQYLHPASYTALDLNPDAIKFCQGRHKVSALTFVHGNAQDLPFDDESFDAVINVEASIHYPNFPGFLAEVVRVLRPGGHFLYTDLRETHQLDEWEKAISAAPLRIVATREIGPEIIRGLQTNPLLDQMPRLVPNVPVLRKLARGVAEKAATAVSDRLASGDSYRLYLFVKD